jgi:hypothetical protein
MRCACYFPQYTAQNIQYLRAVQTRKKCVTLMGNAQVFLREKDRPMLKQDEVKAVAQHILLLQLGCSIASEI